jgi:hypothetical protein
MMQPPVKIAGLRATPQPSAAPISLESASAAGLDTNLHLEQLRWNMGDFTIEGLDARSGWFTTYLLRGEDVEHHLVQSESSFWTSQDIVLQVKAPSRIRADVERAPVPQWKRRSERHWPARAGNLLLFVCQFELSSSTAYLFKDKENPDLLALHVVRSDEQGSEEHYAQEERRARKA